MIPLWALTALRSKWTWIIVPAVVVLIVCVVAIHNYGQAQYKRGMLTERQVWSTVIQEAVEASNRQRARIRQLTEAQDVLSAQLRLERSRRLTQTQTEIHNAASVADQYRIYRAHSDSLRNESAANLARARADYLSSIGPDGRGGPASPGPGDGGPTSPGGG